jgi:hypothetical protein
MTEKRGIPRYYGMFKHVDEEGGYTLWFPTGWHRFDLVEGHQGVIYSPYPGDLNTSFLAEKRSLDYSITKKDVPVLRDGFQEGLMALPGIEIEAQEETVTPTLIALEARLTFLDGEVRRKRWVRNVYWGNGQLILIAQGATVEEFDYWLPMFYNTMMTFEV